MEIAASLVKQRIWRSAVVGVALAFAWIVLSLVLGFDGSHARAADGDGLLGGATAIVDDAADGATQTLGTVAATATGVVSSVMEAAPEPLQQPVAAVAGVADGAIDTVVTPVAAIVDSGPVGAVVAPVVGAVSAVPIVGDLVSGLGVDDAAGGLATTVDGTLSSVVGVVPGVTAGLPASGPAPESSAAPAATPLVLAQAALVAAVAAFDTSRAHLEERAAAVFAVPAHPLRDAATGVVAASLLLLTAGGLCLSSLSSGPGGAGPGAWALAALLPVAAHRAWVRRSGPQDEHAPPAPPGSTDVSPD